MIWYPLVGDPSTRKSPAIRQVVRPLERVQQTWTEEWERARAEWKKLPKEEREQTAPPVRRRILTTDATLEALARVLKNNPAGLLWYSDELRSLIHGLGQYKDRGSRGGDRAKFLSMWSAYPLEIDRVRHEDDPIYVARPIVQLVGGIQPDMLAPVFGHDQDGLRFRFLYSLGYQRAATRVVTIDTERNQWKDFLSRLIAQRDQVRILGVTAPR